jgi:hypothetical protein
MSRSAQKSQKMRLKLKKIRELKADPVAETDPAIVTEPSVPLIGAVTYTLAKTRDVNPLSIWIERWLAAKQRDKETPK